MAHRDLNDKSIPLTSYPSLAPQPPQTPQAPQAPQVPQGYAPQAPQGLVYAQPVGLHQQHVPYAQPVAAYQPYYTTEPQYVAAVNMPPPPPPQSPPPLPSAQPAAVPQTFRDLKSAVRGREGFNHCRYLSDAHRFTCKNFCALLAIMLCWLLVGWAVSGAIEGITYGRHHSSWNFEGNFPEGGDYFPHNSSSSSSAVPATSDSSAEWGWSKADFANFERSLPHGQELGRAVAFGGLHLLASILLWGPALAGVFLAVFNAIRSNGKIKFRDFFRCFRCLYYCQLMKLNVVLHFVKGFLYLLFVLPGVWWSLVTMFAIPLHKEYPFLGVQGAIRISQLAIHRHFCQMICFLMLLALIQVAGFFCMFVGLLYTLPLAFTALCFCFDDIIGLVPFAPSGVQVEGVEQP